MINADPTTQGIGDASVMAFAVSSVTAVALLVIAWYVPSTVIQWDPALWYLNWVPGMYSLYSFLNVALGPALSVVFLLIGIVKRPKIARLAT